jgi:HicB family.
MSKAMSVRLPKYLHREIKKLAEEEGISMNQFIATAATEKVSSLKTVEYLEKRAEHGSREKFERVLSKVPGAELEEHDKL